MTSRLTGMLGYLGGRTPQAAEEANRAHALDPLSPIIRFAQAQVYFRDRQYEILNQIDADNAGFPVATYGRSWVY